MCDLFGFLQIGGSPSELDSVRASLAFNRSVTATFNENEFWSPSEFRYSANEEHFRSFQTIVIYKYYTRLHHNQISALIRQAFSKLAWSSGYLVDRSIDRSMYRDPVAVEYDLVNSSWDGVVRAVGESMEINVQERLL